MQAFYLFWGFIIRTATEEVVFRKSTYDDMLSHFETQDSDKKTHQEKEDIIRQDCYNSQTKKEVKVIRSKYDQHDERTKQSQHNL